MAYPSFVGCDLGGDQPTGYAIPSACFHTPEITITLTSDDEEVLGIAQQYANQGVIAYKRPDELATDIASTVDVLIDAIKTEQSTEHTPKTLVLLQPTSPLRDADDIRAALDAFCDGGCEDTVVTVCEVDHPTAWVGTINKNSFLEGIDLSGKRSQDFKKEYRLNGAIYVSAAETLMDRGNLYTENVRACVMVKGRSFDIDEKIDFLVCDYLLRTI